MTPEERDLAELLREYRKKGANLKLPDKFIPKLPLMVHQKMGFHYCTKLSSAGLFFEMGLGKTCVAINAMRYRIEKGEVKRILVLAPKAVLPTWEAEIKKHSDLRSVILHDSNRDTRIELFNEEAEFYVINYDALRLFKDEINDINADAIIFDEVTRIKSITAQRTKEALKLAKQTKYKLALSGQPITNSLLDAYTIMTSLDPTIFGDNFYKWRYQYFADKGKAFSLWVPKPNAAVALKNKIYQISVRYTKKECLDLPNKVYQNHYIDLSPKQEKTYQDVAKKILVELEKKKVHPKLTVVQLMRLSQIEDGFVRTDKVFDSTGEVIDEGEIVDLGSNKKIEALSELLDDLLYNGKKVIIWARFRHSIQSIMKLCEKKNIGYVTLYGGTPDKERKVVEKEFNSNPKVQVFIGHPRAGGLGIGLVAADVTIYYSLTESLEDYLQSQDRNHRIGSEIHDKITYIHFICKGKISEKMLAGLRRKKGLADLVVEQGFRSIIGENNATT